MPRKRKKSDLMRKTDTKARIRGLRESDDYRREEQQKDARGHQKARKDTDFRRREQQSDTLAHQSARQNEEFRRKEQQSNTLAHQSARQNEEFRRKEQQSDTLAHQNARQNADFREHEQQTNTLAHQSARQNEEFRRKEQQSDTLAHQTARQNEEFREQEQQSNSLAHQSARQNLEFRKKEQQRDTLAHQSARQNKEFRKQEQQRDTLAHKKTRQNEEFAIKERETNKNAHRAARTMPQKRIHEFHQKNARNEKKIRTQTFEDLCAQFNEEIRDQPKFVCPCCGRLLYKQQTFVMHRQEVLKKNSPDFVKSVFCTSLQGNTEELRFCHACKTNISQGKVPRLALSNGLDFPPIPTDLKDLTPLEERLVALRLPFMQIRPMGVEQQSKLIGNVVNVENDLNITTSVIPRRFDETSTLQVLLMRRMQYRHAHMHETIRPHKVHRAAKYLIRTELYKDVKLSNRLSNFSDDATCDFICDPNLASQHCDANQINDEVAQNEEAEVIDGAEETLIHDATNKNLVTGFRIAPGEGKRPIPLFADPYAEEMSFPSIYCGRKRTLIQTGGKNQRKLTYTDIAKSEIMRYDRRACKPTKILYAFKKSFNEKVSQCVTTFLRKKRGKKGKYKASQVRDSEFLKKTIDNDEGYTIFKNLRSAPTYWAAKCKKAIAMVRQLGKCTFFITLSAAERKWNELLVLLTRLLRNKDITESEAKDLTDEEKNYLIRNDPVTCMRHFDRRFQSLLRNIIKAKQGMFAPYALDDFFHRLEFQMRGSPHSHGIYWIKDAPDYIEGNEESVKLCAEFIDKFITCKRSGAGELNQLIKYQLHRHSHTCRKGMKNRLDCRFGFPKPPLPCTMILNPLPKNVNVSDKKKWSELYAKIKVYLNERGRTSLENPDFKDYLKSFKIGMEDYILAIRSSIKRATVFHKREVNEAFVNPYNPQLLLAWKANIDIQFVLDTYACAKYCVGYIMKSDGGMSKLLRQVNRSAASGNQEICGKLDQYAKILWTGTEISAQEAAGFLMGIPNTKCSRGDIYIDTSPPQERTHILKPLEELQKLNDNDENIYQSGLVDHYINRSTLLENVCLAEFASNFEFSKTNRSASKHEDDMSEEEIEFVADASFTYYKQIDSSGFMRKRKGPSKIIRFRHYSRKQEPFDYWREQLMLYIPWRNEDDELMNNPIEKANMCLFAIDEMSSNFCFSRDVSDEVLQQLASAVTDELSSDSDDDNDDYVGHHEDQNQLADSMINPNLGKVSGKKIEQFLPPKIIDNEEYNNLMRSLNERQRRFVLNVLYRLKSTNDPFYMFLSGGAGVGKSLAITAIVQCALRYFGKIPGRNQENMSVIVSAFTGKAAFNIFGMTLHCAFRLPPVQSRALDNLDDDKCNTLRKMFSGLKLIIIDEISMCSLKLLQSVDQRMRQIFGTNLDFGGCSVIVVGHLRQLPPICGQFPFENERGKEAINNHLWRKFNLYELNEIMRQRGEMGMCKALNNMSEGQMDNEDVKLMKSCQISQKGEPPSNSIWLFRFNEECAKHNKLVHERLGTQGFLSTAVDSVQGKKASKEQKQRLLLDAKSLSIQNCDGLRYETFLIENAQYFISNNVAVQDGLFNGATGKLMHLEYRDTTEPCSTTDSRLVRAWMLFENNLIGTEKRKSYLASHHGKIPSFAHPSWTPIEKITKLLSKMYNGNLRVVRQQFPLVACNGMTVAKSQGSSLPSVTVSVRGKKLTRAQLYVACSRATSLDGLYIDGDFCPPDLPEEPDIVGQEMDRLRSNPFIFSMQFLQDLPSNMEKIYFHNIQSLQQHSLDILADHCAMAANYILLVEPHILFTDNLNLPGFQVIHRTNCTSTRNSEGIILFAKGTLQVKIVSFDTDFYRRYSCTFLKFQIRNVTVIGVYRHPNYPRKTLKQLLERELKSTSGRTIITGDFNIDIMHEHNSDIKSLFDKYKFNSLLSPQVPSTNGGTQIDCCFTNFGATAWFYETYYSYHKAICITYLTT